MEDNILEKLKELAEMTKALEDKNKINEVTKNLFTSTLLIHYSKIKTKFLVLSLCNS